MKTPHYSAVIGANFGDEGKGLVTDCIASLKNALIILHNGGPQRAHTVGEGPTRHVYRHFGSTVRSNTYIASTFVVNPIIFREEYETFPRYERPRNVYIHPECMLTTLYDMLINQVIEFDRLGNKHGTCGFGVYETLLRNNRGIDFINKPDVPIIPMTVGKFASLSKLEKLNFLNEVRLSYVEKRFNQFGLQKIGHIFENVLASDVAILNYLNDFEFMLDHSILLPIEEMWFDYNEVIFENGQGLLLDQHNKEYFPHLTPSNTGFDNIAGLLASMPTPNEPVDIYYVSRTYLTRHGAGTFPGECSKSAINSAMQDKTNVPNPYQDTLRYGLIDYSSLLERITSDSKKCKYANNLNLVMTHTNEYPVPPSIPYTHYSNSPVFMRRRAKN